MTIIDFSSCLNAKKYNQQKTMLEYKWYRYNLQAIFVKFQLRDRKDFFFFCKTLWSVTFLTFEPFQSFLITRRDWHLLGGKNVPEPAPPPSNQGISGRPPPPLPADPAEVRATQPNVPRAPRSPPRHTRPSHSNGPPEMSMLIRVSWGRPGGQGSSRAAAPSPHGRR